MIRENLQEIEKKSGYIMLGFPCHYGHGFDAVAVVKEYSDEDQLLFMSSGETAEKDATNFFNGVVSGDKFGSR